MEATAQAQKKLSIVTEKTNESRTDMATSSVTNAKTADSEVTKFRASAVVSESLTTSDTVPKPLTSLAASQSPRLREPKQKTKDNLVIVDHTRSSQIKRARTTLGQSHEDVQEDQRARRVIEPKIEKDEDEWYFETDARFFMGYFWWVCKKNGGSMLKTWWMFFGPRIKRTWIETFFFQVGVTIGYMVARVFIIPDYMQGFYKLNYDAMK